MKAVDSTNAVAAASETSTTSLLPHSDSPVALEFLDRFANNGRVTLAAINPETRQIKVETFDASDVEGRRRFIDAYQGTANLYFCVNPLRRAMFKKPEKGDVAYLAWLHVDIDPKKGKELQAERARILAVIQSFPNDLSPSLIIDSGNGYQCFWKLHNPLPIEGETAAFEKYNLALQRVFGGDNCWNIDRIMRLPGTINLPDAKKRAVGRVPALAKIVEFNDRTFDLSSFDKFLTTESHLPVADIPNPEIDWEHLPKIDVNDLPVSKRIKALIRKGPDLSEYDSRSEAGYAVLTAMHKAACGAETIAATFLDEKLGIGAYIREDKSPQKAILGEIRRVRTKVPVQSIEEDKAAKSSQADILVRLTDELDLFHSPDGTGYADILVNEHRETWRLRSSAFRQWLARQFWVSEQRAPSGEALRTALGVIEGKARYDGVTRDVFIRTAEIDDMIFIDLCDSECRAIEVDANGWRVVSNPPVRFRRAPGMLPLPRPVPGGSIQLLRKFLNLEEQKDEEQKDGEQKDFVLLIAWLVAALRAKGPYPILIVRGEQGTAKSTLVKLLRLLVDPNVAPLRSLPREDRDLFIAANNGHILAFDNLSGLPPWVSDTLCRLATGGGFATRALTTDSEEQIFDAVRPIILNGITEFATREDLIDRSIFIRLQKIPGDRRQEEGAFLRAFAETQPLILGALLDALVCGLKTRPQIKLERVPRMADFAYWASACEPALWSAGTFVEAYSGNQSAATDTVLEGDVVAGAIRKFVGELPKGKEGIQKWSGTATMLLDELNRRAVEVTARWDKKVWPQSPRSMSNHLDRLAPVLRAGAQIDIVRDRTGSDRLITLTSLAPPAERQTEEKRGNFTAPDLFDSDDRF